MPWTISTTGFDRVRQQYTLAAQMTGSMIGQVFTRRLTEAVTYARATYRSASVTTPTATAVRTGALRAALGMRVEASGTSVTGTLGYVNAAVPYAGVHEGLDGRTQTVIRPKTGKFLAIPLPGAKTAAGVARGSPRDFPDTFFATSKRGNLILFQRQGNTIVPLFLMRGSVTVPARPALRPTIERFIPLIVQDLTEAVSQNLKG